MKRALWIPAVALLASVAGCILVSAQIFTTFDLENIHVTGATGMDHQQVDLNTIGDYKDHKDNFKTLADFAVVGDFSHPQGTTVNVEVYITPGFTNYTTPSQVTANATLLWGPFQLQAGELNHHMGWTESAKVLHDPGKQVLIDAAKGDGQFTVYAFGVVGDHDFDVTNGKLLLVLDVAK
ncbi:MAG TPA: hypothetical protein VMS93_12175 [Candidatus Saccharimonadales bacterium]|nr:hypothetical protein [Candidatus Saccharimonadales bacterium]